MLGLDGVESIFFTLAGVAMAWTRAVNNVDSSGVF